MHEEQKPEVERRNNFRIDMERELIEILWTDENQQQQEKTIECLDFSRGGAKVTCDQALAVHTPVVIVFKSANLHSQRLYAKVLRCIEVAPNEYEIGLRLDDEANQQKNK